MSLDSPATSTPTRSALLYDALGKPLPLVGPPDPAWAPPGDPLAGVNLAAQAGVVHREIPIVVTATGWEVPTARRALQDLAVGLFDAPGQLADDVMGSDSRTQAALQARLSILGRPVDFRLPHKYRDSSLARECLAAFVEAWPTMATEATMGELQRWAIMMGFGIAQIQWDTSGDYAIPRPLPWHPRYTYFHWLYRCYVAITMDRQEPIIAGDGSWIIHAPHGEYRGWMRGGLRAITPWWLGRHYALRDWMRYSERHGLPIVLFKSPAVGDPIQQSTIRFQLANLGQESVLHLPQNPPPVQSYDVDLLEARDTAHEGFRMLIAACDSEITLTLMAQTLTTSMPAEGGSSYAAARIHAGVLQGLMEADARALSMTVYQQIARPFAAMNFGNADLAPRVVWDVTPFEDAKTKALAFMQIAEALNFMRVAGFQLDPRDVRRLINNTIPGFRIGKMDAVAPLAVAAIGAKAKADQKAANQVAQQDTAGARIAAQMQGARFDPNLLSRVRVNLAEDTESDGMREAMAEIEAAHSRQSRRVRR